MKTPELKKIVSLIALLSFVIIIIVSGCKKKEEEEDPEQNTPTFCYSVTTSTTAYDTINGGTELTSYNADDVFEFDLGYSFDFCGTTFQKFYICWNFTSTFT